MDKASNSEVWTQGIESGMNNKLVLEAANKFENGESLTESEKALLDATALEAVAQKEFGGDLRKRLQSRIHDSGKCSFHD